MAQTGYTPILIYASGTTGNTPSAANLTSSASGAELAINYFDGKLFYKDNAGVVQVLATKGTGPIGGSNTQVQYNSSGALAGSSNLTFDGTTLTANALTVTNNPTLSGGTANGVVYLNGSKVATSGSALTFDGTNLATTGSGTVKNLLLSGGTLPGAGNPSISLRSSDNVIYHQSGSANTIVMLDSAQNTMQSIGATAQIWNISNSEQMRLTSTGLGIGTSSPANRLTVAAANAKQNIQSTTGTNEVVLYLTNTGGDFYLGRENSAGTYFNAPAYSTNLYSGGAYPMLFWTGATERARITSGGELCVGTTATTSGARLDVKGVDSTGSNYCMFFENSSNSLLFAVQNDGRWRSGTAAASPYNYVVGATNRDLFVDNGGEIGYVSSVRASKTNIAPVSNVDWLLQLNPVTFNFRKKDVDGNYTEEADGPLKHGLIAEEVEAVNSDLCFYDDAERGGALRGVNYTHLITPMLKLIQEQQALITDLRARVQALEAQP